MTSMACDGMWPASLPETDLLAKAPPGRAAKDARLGPVIVAVPTEEQRKQSGTISWDD